MNCCGKVICRGCVFAFQLRTVLAGKKEEDQKCPFCRVPNPFTDAEIIKRHKKRIDLNDARAINSVGYFYYDGSLGLPRDHAKALQLWHRAAELGCADALFNIGYAYKNGRGVEQDMKKAIYYLELAATRGHVTARHNLGIMEYQAGNMERALKHWMIAVKDGEYRSLKSIKRLYSDGHAAKDDYTKALRSYQTYLAEVKNDQRDEAAAAISGTSSEIKY